MGSTAHRYICQLENLVFVYQSLLASSDAFKDVLIDPKHLPKNLLETLQGYLDTIIQRGGAVDHDDTQVDYDHYLGVYRDFCLFERHHLLPGHRVVSIQIADLCGNVHIVSVDKTLMV